MNRLLPLTNSLHRVLFFGVAALLCFGLGNRSIAATAPEIWLAGVPPFARSKMFQESESDYLELFRADAPWSNAASHVQVFLTNGGLILRESDDQLKSVFADLKRRHIALAVETGLLAGKDSAGRQACGVGIEGFIAPDQGTTIANRILKNGGTLDYIVLDEPLWYGHVFHGPNACQSSIEDVAREVAARVVAIRKIFPSVKVGDNEPAATLQPSDWLDQITKWTKAYQTAAGEPFSFFNADVQWSGPWKQQLPVLKKLVEGEGSKFGIIYNGGGSAAQESDEVWTQEAEDRFRAVETNPALVPDIAVLQTWGRWPKKMLPENQRGTMTNLVIRYLSPR